MEETAPHGEDGEASRSFEEELQTIAAELRVERRRAGDPTLGTLSRSTHISKSALSDAFSGRRLPSVRTIEILGEELGFAPAALLERRRAAQALLPGRGRGGERAEPGRAEPPAPEQPGAATAGERPAAAERLGADAKARNGGPGRRYRLRALVLVGVVGLLIGAATAGPVAWSAAMRQAAAAPPAPEPSLRSVTGDHPMLAGCADDAKVVSGTTRMEHYLIEIRFSARCNAYWGRMMRFDDRTYGNSMTVHAYRMANPNGPERQTAIERDVQIAYTTVVVPEYLDDRICVSGSVTLDGREIDLGDPICT
ncbi:MAG: DUF2690 domain-containing protein [Pseudoclavibacter sp.]|nr:DUF2690 domain-containing protein [Pseudoclavibacter sp.]